MTDTHTLNLLIQPHLLLTYLSHLSCLTCTPCSPTATIPQEVTKALSQRAELAVKNRWYTAGRAKRGTSLLWHYAVAVQQLRQAGPLPLSGEARQAALFDALQQCPTILPLPLAAGLELLPPPSSFPPPPPPDFPMGDFDEEVMLTAVGSIEEVMLTAVASSMAMMESSTTSPASSCYSRPGSSMVGVHDNTCWQECMRNCCCYKPLTRDLLPPGRPLLPPGRPLRAAVQHGFHCCMLLIKAPRWRVGGACSSDTHGCHATTLAGLQRLLQLPWHGRHISHWS